MRSICFKQRNLVQFSFQEVLKKVTFLAQIRFKADMVHTAVFTKLAG
jgi:hypothetical protein